MRAIAMIKSTPVAGSGTGMGASSTTGCSSSFCFSGSIGGGANIGSSGTWSVSSGGGVGGSSTTGSVSSFCNWFFYCHYHMRSFWYFCFLWR
uniref:Uncharacterized protein n=1 Tax=Anopheles arabiensis TaxID=7173 RepID=A0A182IFQ0_ANOAR